VEYSLSGERRTIKTDALCGIQDPDDPPPTFLFIELDTGSQSHATIGHKAMAYNIMLTKALHKAQFGFSVARVLFATAGHLRAKKLARTITRRAPETADQFRLKVIPEIATNSRPPLTGHVLIDGCSMPVFNK